MASSSTWAFVGGSKHETQSPSGLREMAASIFFLFINIGLGRRGDRRRLATPRTALKT
jgi:hypothetical protein